MSPTHKMPDGRTVARTAVVAELRAALAAARCASYVAGLATADFAARELLLVTLQEIDRATRAAGRLGD